MKKEENVKFEMRGITFYVKKTFPPFTTHSLESPTTPGGQLYLLVQMSCYLNGRVPFLKQWLHGGLL